MLPPPKAPFPAPTPHGRLVPQAITKEKISAGDVIYIEANSGAVKRVGRSDAYATEFDLEVRGFLQVPLLAYS